MMFKFTENGKCKICGDEKHVLMDDICIHCFSNEDVIAEYKQKAKKIENDSEKYDIAMRMPVRYKKNKRNKSIIEFLLSSKLIIDISESELGESDEDSDRTEYVIANLTFSCSNLEEDFAKHEFVFSLLRRLYWSSFDSFNGINENQAVYITPKIDEKTYMNILLMLEKFPLFIPRLTTGKEGQHATLLTQATVNSLYDRKANYDDALTVLAGLETETLSNSDDCFMFKIGRPTLFFKTTNLIANTINLFILLCSKLNQDIINKITSLDKLGKYLAEMSNNEDVYISFFEDRRILDRNDGDFPYILSEDAFECRFDISEAYREADDNDYYNDEDDGDGDIW